MLSKQPPREGGGTENGDSVSVKRRKRVGAIALALGLVALMIILLLTAVHAVGTNGALYHRLQARAWAADGAADPSGISDADLRALDGALAAYLAGDAAALRAPDADGDVMELEVYGAMQPAFNAKELAHLEDCHRLFALLRKVRARLIPWTVLLIVGGAYLLADRRRARRAALLSPVIPLIPLGAFAAWAIVDFDGAFTCFHRVLFTNDLWLLDPRTDLLIRICPEAMFMDMGRRIALWGLAILIGVPAIATLITTIWPKSNASEGNTWDNRATRRASAQRRMTFDIGEKR